MTEEADEGQECPVCFEATRGHRLQPCGHSVCRSCAARWLEEHDSCPLCRREVRMQRESRSSDSRERIQITVFTSHLRGRRFEFVDEADGEGWVRFDWDDDPEWLYANTLHVQHGDRITHIDGFDVQNAAWTRRIFERAMARNRILRCSVLLEGRSCPAPSLRETLMLL